MSRQRPEVNMIDFFEMFSPEYVTQKRQVGMSAEVFVTINCSKFSSMDCEIFRAVLFYGEKSEVNGMIVSVVNIKELLTYVPVAKSSLEDALHRFSRVSMDVVYSQNNERYEGHYNLFDVMMSSDVSGNSSAITLGIKSLEVLEWLFEQDFIDLIKSNISVR